MLSQLTKLAGTAMSRDFDSCTVEDNFCLYTFQLLLSSLIFSARETDVDSLLLLRNEVRSRLDLSICLSCFVLIGFQPSRLHLLRIVRDAGNIKRVERRSIF